MSQAIREAANAVSELFPDGGQALLDAVGLAPTWLQLLDITPQTVWFGAEDGVGVLRNLRDFWWVSGALEPAIVATRAVMGWARQTLGDGHADTLVEVSILGTLVVARGRLDEGEQLLEHAWMGLQDGPGDDLRRAKAAEGLARLQLIREHYERAGTLLEVAFAIRERVAPNTAGEVAAQLGQVRVLQGLPERAVIPLRRAWVLHREVLGDEHPACLRLGMSLGRVLARLDRYSDLIGPVSLSAKGFEARGAETDMAAARYLLGVAEYRCGNEQAGLRQLEAAMRLSRSVRTEDGLPLLQLPERLAGWAGVLLDRGRGDEARRALQEALDVARTLHGDSSPQVAHRTSAMGVVEVQLGRPTHALSWLEAGASLSASALGHQHQRTKKIVVALVEVATPLITSALDRRDRPEAEGMLARVLPVAAGVLGTGDARVVALEQMRARLR